MFIKIYHKRGLAGENPEYLYDFTVIDNVKEAKFVRTANGPVVELSFEDKYGLTTDSHLLDGDAYLMNENGKTIEVYRYDGSTKTREPVILTAPTFKENKNAPVRI